MAQLVKICSININWHNGGWIIIMGRNHSGWINYDQNKAASFFLVPDSTGKFFFFSWNVELR